MSEYRVETTLNQDGSLTLTDLPFHAGDAVEVIILHHVQKPFGRERYPLHGTPVEFVGPTDPVAEEDWNTLR
ncbi:MAG: hypothetical protein WD065_09475 [Planctomycetaceae bacterium]